MSEKPHYDADPAALIASARAVIAAEHQAISDLAERIGDDFVQACRIILACSGKTVTLGMGKSGHIGNKIAATLASTGAPSFFVHPGEASHGDLGMIASQDVVLALSNSGETGELLALLPVIKRLDVPLIAMTGRPDSTLGKAATVCLDVSVAKEGCPLGLAPTASTTACLALGDALAVALLEARGFGAEDFARRHPGGLLGRRLLLRVGDVMHTGAGIPQVDEQASLSDALLEMSAKGLGMTVVLNRGGALAGVFTDGDLRRALDAGFNVRAARVGEVMTREARTIHSNALAAEALQMMEAHSINALPVVGDSDDLVGALNMHDLLRARVI